MKVIRSSTSVIRISRSILTVVCCWLTVGWCILFTRGKTTCLFFLCSYKRMPLHHSPSVMYHLLDGKRWIYLCTERILRPIQMQSSVANLEIHKMVSLKRGSHHLCLLQFVFKVARANLLWISSPTCLSGFSLMSQARLFFLCIEHKLN